MLMYSLVQAKHVCQEITCSQVGTARWTALAGSPHGDVTLHLSINCMLPISISFNFKKIFISFTEMEEQANHIKRVHASAANQEHASMDDPHLSLELH